MPTIKFEDYKEVIKEWMMENVMSNEDDCNDVMDMAEETVKEQYNNGVATDLCGSLICEKYSIC